MLRIAMLCAVIAIPLEAAAQSSSHDNDSRHPAAKPDQQQAPTGPSVQSVPRGWQSSGQTNTADTPRPGCAGDRKVGGFCMIN